MKSIELMKRALAEKNDELIEKLKVEENWSEQEIKDIIGDMIADTIHRQEKMGLQWTNEELEEMLGDDGYWD